MKSDGTRQKKTKKTKSLNKVPTTTTKPEESKPTVESEPSKQSPVPSNETSPKVETETEDGLDDKLMELSDQFKERNKTASESSSVVSEPTVEASAETDVNKNDEDQEKTFTLHDSVSSLDNNEKTSEKILI